MLRVGDELITLIDPDAPADVYKRQMLYMFHNLSAKSVRSLKSGWFASSGETTPRSSNCLLYTSRCV